MANDKIVIKGAREHNLKNVNLTLPREKFIVITGLSGSGKSSLAFDTIYAEGQRRYVESLSAYARQFLELMKKPDVDSIEGLSPAISIEQKTTSHNPRSTVGTVTEIYDYMRLLWARAGTPYSPATGLPIHLHFGKQLNSPNELPSPDERQNIAHIRETRRRHTFQEYPAFHSALYSESCLLALHSSGSRGTRLEFDSFQLRSEGNAETLELLLVDKLNELFFTVFYTVYADSSLLDRRAVIRNGSTAPVTLQQAFSASLPLPWSDTPGRITHLHGYWAAEGQIAHTVLEAGKLVLESRTGLSGPFAMPFFAMDDGSATEESGDLLFGTLQWSGNWKIVVERNDNIDSVISGGINDFDFQWNLRPGAAFETPVFTFGFAEHGFGEMFRKIHRHIRTHIEPESTRGKVMPLICNTYGAFRSGEKMNAANTERAIQKAAALGAELFVFDAGWQETLGDWTAHHSKFHGTIRPQAELAHRLGMNFGAWAERESADRASSTFRDHREWFMQYPDQFPADDELDDSASG